MICDQLKKKWKNLRDSYGKYLRAGKTTTGQETKILDRCKTWPWALQMQFLRPFLKFAKRDSNIPKQILAEEQVEDDNTEQVGHGEQVNINPASVPQEPPATTRKRKSEGTTPLSSSVEQVIQYLEN
ncbi:hypothetical protein ILUMI_20345 [Ignelater luminosus]|uniref:MADF domain-containing protein n=1 Tax=Ignelater luminosus TaxID=2038154 RepID=A0A8K0CGJ3_IGNLU|nr:hypothetical protein ILUMI_20345 [Ignelater luminosus]